MLREAAVGRCRTSTTLLPKDGGRVVIAMALLVGPPSSSTSVASKTSSAPRRGRG